MFSRILGDRRPMCRTLPHTATRLLGWSFVILAVAFGFRATEARAGESVATSAPSSQPIEADLSGHWEGRIEGDLGHIGLFLDLARHDGGWSGTAVVPEWGERRWLLSDVQVRSIDLDFSLNDGENRTATFSGSVADSAVIGTYAWRGERFRFWLRRKRLDKSKYVRHPQVPLPPFPYAERDVEFKSGSLTLSARLAVPSGKGPFVAAILLGGSKPEPRDPRVPGGPDEQWLLPWVLADRMARAGVATLRTDSRGIGGSGGNFDEATLSDRAGDALSAVRFLRSCKEVDANRIGLLGLSEGGVVAPMAAANSKAKDVAYLVLLAAPAVPGDELGLEQGRRTREAIARRNSHPRRRAASANSEDQAPMREADYFAQQRVLFDLAKGPLSRKQVLETYNDYIVKSGHSNLFIERDVASTMTPHMRSFLRYDPRPILRETTVPVLALYGGQDISVPSDQSKPELDRVVREGKNLDFTVKCLDGIGHGLHSVGADDPLELKDVEDVVDVRVIDLVTRWIDERFAPRQSN